MYGFAVGYGGAVLATSDAGITWYEQNSHTTADLYSVKMLDSVHAIASGENGTIIRTANGGKASVSILAKRQLSLSLHPNPASTYADVTYDLPASEAVTLCIIDALGRTVLRKGGVRRSEGEQTQPLDLIHIPSGSYWLTIESESYTGMIPLRISK